MKKINEKVVAIPPTVETRGLPCNDIRDCYYFLQTYLISPQSHIL